jgi:protein tyrosine phosphatase (PTP) superfamily phosphohydrolase (DUF442 family)
MSSTAGSGRSLHPCAECSESDRPADFALGVVTTRVPTRICRRRGVAEGSFPAGFGAKQVTPRLGYKPALCAAIVIASACGVLIHASTRYEKRVRIVLPARLIRGAWQTPEALRSIIARERVKTIVTLTAINRDDPKYIGQASVVAETGVTWLFVPMRGSRATLDQMVDAADLLADPNLQPVFFHCVAGHHRSSQAHAAYLIRHCGWAAEAAWKEVAALPWATPGAPADLDDKALIEAFARSQSSVGLGAGLRR